MKCTTDVSVSQSLRSRAIISFRPLCPFHDTRRIPNCPSACLPVGPPSPMQGRLGCWPLLPPEQRMALSRKVGIVVWQEPLEELERETRAAAATKLSREEQVRVGGCAGVVGGWMQPRGLPAWLAAGSVPLWPLLCRMLLISLTCCSKHRRKFCRLATPECFQLR